MTTPFEQHPIGWTVAVAGWLIPVAVFLWRARRAPTLGGRIYFLIAAALPALMAVALVCWLIWPGWFP